MAVSEQARALAERCAPRVNELARYMARQSFERLPGYAELPGDMKDVEIAATARHGLRRFLYVVRGGRPEPVDPLFLERAAQRAEEGMPLHLLLRTHMMGLHVLWRALRESAEPGEEAALVELAELMLRWCPELVGTVAQTYVDERTALEAEHREERRGLVRALLDGSLPPEGPGAARLGLTGPSLVLALGLTPGTPEGPVAVRRRLRRVQTALDRLVGTKALLLLDADAGRAVLPGAAEPPEPLAAELARACGQPVHVAAVAADSPHELPGAARTAAEVLRVARACGRPPGVHRLDDVLLEYHLTRPGESARRIAALLDPIADRPELLETLRTHLSLRQDRRDTAEALGLHPNTVDNRLARTAEQTALDLTSPRGAALALAALLLREDTNDRPGDAT